MEQPKTLKPAKFIFLLAAYIGTVLGVGMYGLPYVLQNSGVIIFVTLLIIISALVLFVNVVFADVIVRSGKSERFLGYVKDYAGPKAEHFFFWTTMLSIWGTLLAYLIVWGKFASVLFKGSLVVPDIVFSLIFFAATFAIIYRPGKTIEKLDIFFIAGVFVLFLVLFFLGMDKIRPLPLSWSSFSSIFLPYGNIMFALWGINIIPEIVNQTRQKISNVGNVLFVGVVITAILYAGFAFLVASISGSSTTSEAFEGLQPFIGRTAVVIGTLMGIFTIFTSYINLGWTARNIFIYDIKMSRMKAMMIVCLPPLALLLVGVANALTVIGLIGSILLGLEGMIVFYLYIKASAKLGPHDGVLPKRVPEWMIHAGMILFAFGVALEVGNVIARIIKAV